jgi:pyruvate/2-oxoglutarate dehydrogenase complex dihydrolipoamide acyltransferase (E2) component
MNGASKVGVDQDPLLDLVNTRDYTIAYGDSPASVAKKFGISLSDLLAANPQKPTTITAGVRTFRELHIGEKLNVPTVGLSGADAIGVGFNFFKAALLPWGAPAEIAESLIAKSLRHRKHVGAPTKGGHNSWERWQQVHPGTPYSDYQNWWNTYGQTGGTIAGAAGVGGAVSDFKAALLPWGAISETEKALRRHPHRRTIQEWYRETHPGQPLPPYFSVGDIAAYHRAVGVGDGTAGVGDAANDAVQALAMVDACDPANVGLVWAAQQALGLDPDGKWGNASMKAAQARGILHAPYGCSPRPSWWAPVGQKNYPPGVSPMPTPVTVAPAPMPVPMPMPMPTPGATPAAAQAAQAAQQAAVQAAQATTPAAAQQAAAVAQQAAAQAVQVAQQNPTPANQQAAATAQQAAAAAVTHEKKHGISTGMIVAGAIGVAALVGIVAIAATSGKKTTTRYRTKKGKTRYITRKAPKRRKHNRSAHKKR